MRAVPFPDSSFDLVVSNLAIHNIKDREGRGQAIDEAVRVLRPGGRLLIADLTCTKAYAQRLRALSIENVVEQRLDWRCYFGVLGAATSLVTATKQTHPATEGLLKAGPFGAIPAISTLKEPWKPSGCS
jgi:ubiquinone/menaquinone biosynthesis C-methylase UbiE